MRAVPVFARLRDISRHRQMGQMETVSQLPLPSPKSDKISPILSDSEEDHPSPIPKIGQNQPIPVRFRGRAPPNLPHPTFPSIPHPQNQTKSAHSCPIPEKSSPPPIPKPFSKVTSSKSDRIGLILSDSGEGLPNPSGGLAGWNVFDNAQGRSGPLRATQGRSGPVNIDERPRRDHMATPRALEKKRQTRNHHSWR